MYLHLMINTFSSCLHMSKVVMAFHECQQHESSDAIISLPKWILDIENENQDIFFTDREGRRNTECLSWGIDKERVLKGRTGIEVGSNASFVLYFIPL